MIFLYFEPLQGAKEGPHYQGPDGPAPHAGFRSEREAEAAMAERLEECGEFWKARVVDLDRAPTELVEQTRRMDGF